MITPISIHHDQALDRVNVLEHQDQQQQGGGGGVGEELLICFSLIVLTHASISLHKRACFKVNSFKTLKENYFYNKYCINTHGYLHNAVKLQR